jgi:lactoylglutathione lyase
VEKGERVRKDLKAKFVYVGIRVKDIQESIEFYTKMLGMKVVGESRIAGSKGNVATLQSGSQDFFLELNHYDKDSPYNRRYVVGEALDHLAFGVDDLDGVVLRAKRARHRVVKEFKTAESRWLYIKDPNGIWIELFESA